MGNSLKTLRVKSGATQEQIAEAIGVSKSQYVKLERGERRLTEDYIERLARAYGVRPADVISSETPDAVPLMGYIGAGAEIEPDYEQTPPNGLDIIDVPFPLPDDMVAFQVRGDSMLPVYRADAIIICYREQQRPFEAFLGEEAVVRTTDGRRFIKTITKSANGRPYVNLLSFNAPIIEDVQLEWIGEIFAVLPKAAARKIAQIGHKEIQYSSYKTYR